MVTTDGIIEVFNLVNDSVSLFDLWEAYETIFLIISSNHNGMDPMVYISGCNVIPGVFFGRCYYFTAHNFLSSTVSVIFIYFCISVWMCVCVLYQISCGINEYKHISELINTF